MTDYERKLQQNIDAEQERYEDRLAWCEFRLFLVRAVILITTVAGIITLFARFFA